MKLKDTVSLPNFAGDIKIYQTCKATGERKLLVEKKNLITYTGADLIARCLAGEAHSSISHFYIGYNNTASFTPPPVTLYSKAADFDLYESPFGYIRVPLSWNPSFFNENNYDSNIPVFSVVIASATAAAGAAFGATSRIFEAGMIAATNPVDPAQDILFNRVNFTPILFDPAYNLTVVWGVTCRAA